MKKNPFPYWAIAAVAAIAITRTTNAATNTWTGTSGSDIFWSTPGNWSPSGPPGVGDQAQFFNQGAVSDNTADNVVTSDITIERLWIGQTNPPNHNLTINSGATLTIQGTADNGYGPLGSDPLAGGITADPVMTKYASTIYVGTKTTNAVGTVVTETISGGGKLVVNNPNNEINVRQSWPAGGGAHRGVLDLSKLNTFVATLGRIRVGDGEAQPLNRAEGDMYLAATNNITLSGSNYQDNVQLVVGNNDVNQNQSNPSFLILGGQNVLNLDEMLVGGKKQPGTMRGTNGFPSLTLKMRGSDGVSRVRAIRVGDASDQPTSGNGTTGILNLTDDTIDILADTISLGKSQSTGTGAGSLSLGRLFLGAGTLDVNTIDVAFRMDNNAATTSAASGSLDFSNTTVKVNSLLRLGRNVPGRNPMVATVNMNGGSLTIVSNLVIQGAVSFTNLNGLVAFSQPGALTVSNLVVDGGTISNASLISATNQLTIANNGVILGNTAFDMGNDASKSWDVTGIAGGSLVSSNSFFGGGSLLGNLVQGNGGIVGAGGNGTVGTLTINGDLTLNTGSLAFDVGNNASGGNDSIAVSGTLTANAINDVNLTALAGGFDTAQPYTLITSTTLVGDQTHYRAAGPLSLSRYTFTFSTSGNSLRMTVGGAGAKSLTWVGDGSANLWNAQGAANWNDGAAASTFFTLDNVSITDSGSATPAINLTGTLIPGTTVVNNTTKSYGIAGSGGLAASGPFTKSGTNSLTLTNGAGNSFNSLVSIQNGTLVFGNTGQNTFKNGINLSGTGALVFSGNNSNNIRTLDGSTALTIAPGTSVTVSNAGANTFPNPIQLDGALIFNQTVSASLDGTITGSGPLVKGGSGTLTINGANTGLSTNVVVTGGTVKVGSASALGTAGVVITNDATVDIVGNNLGSLSAIVSGTGVGGTGAIVSTGPPLVTGSAGIGLTTITMTGDTTVGGSGPWDTDPVKNLGVWGLNNGTLSTGGSNFNFVKVGLNQFGLSGGTTVDPALGNIDVKEGLLALQGGVTSLGDPGSNITIRAGATVSFFDTTTPWDKKFILFGDGATPNLFNYNGANIIIGTVTLNGNCVIGAAPLSRGAPVSLTINSTISGTGGFVKSGLDAVILTGTNTYTGGTLVSAGRLILDGRNTGGGGLTNLSGSTIAGVGTNDGLVQIAGTLSPGDDSITTGTLGTGPLTINGGSTLVFDVDNSASDHVEVNGNLTLNGSIGIKLNIANITVGQNYPLIHYTGSLTGGTNGLFLLPLLPGFNLNIYSNANVIGVTVAYLPLTKVWKGTAAGAARLWDNVSLNWFNSGNPDVFNLGDFATFDDTGTNIVTVVGNQSTAGITLNNNSSNYFFGGAGKITGVGGISANGGSSLFLTNSGVNDFSGGLTVGAGGGFLVVGNGGTNGTIGTGPVTNLSAITFNRSGTNTVNNSFHGAGAVTNVAGVLVLGGDNSDADMNLDITNSSTLRPASATALGAITGAATIESGSTLDVNGQNNGAKTVTVSGTGVGGNGAIINTGIAQNSALQSITLAGNTTFGGTTRWDLRAGTASALNTGGNPFNITKVGANQVSLVSITNVDGALGDIDIQGGTFAVQNNTGQLGDPNHTLYIRTGATLDLFNLNLNPLNKIINVTNTGVITNESGSSIIIGPISILGKVTFGVTNSLTITNIDSFTNAGVVTNITKTGSGVLTLISNTLPSSTLIDIVQGTIDINQQSTGSTLTLGAGQTLRGNGNLAGSLVANVGSTVAPGEATNGILTVSNSIVLGGGTTFMKVSKTANTNDVLRTSGSISYSGTLVVSNSASSPLVGGETYKLFNAASYSGVFSAIIPATPGAGMTWNTSNLAVNGTISVAGTGGGSPTTNANILKVTLSGTNLLVHGTNNNVPNTSFHFVVLTSTNLTNALSTWTPVYTNTFNANGTFDYTNPIVPGTRQQFIDVKAVP
jgi:autotransporter-associated beta strand protein